MVKLNSIEEVDLLANTKSAKKRIAIIKKRTLRNKMIKSRVKTFIRRFNESLATKDIEAIKERLRLAVKELDKAVSKGVLHKNTAARKKSKLYAKFNALLKSASNE
ncbi:MAG: 30S ribosomal protein S20 [Caldanaerobacter subterraneus]|jgi:small subunit ribosomal protein S20|uniref:Small ribosomal subunit protein bS20 n=3 Tax=Caldanaerobacter subterraneus TaxID=911092 RepID=RS20_CALS4|nr:RecName: Full=Small ribosomal subunit protein bS20; AltName: Full=30S ribosomal protein S20 [Caldanaerobacter subterraneus subsp. tengcongensis MB4]KKC29970.1 30S ribosomal protein S20 [Caldanaerobacter subterraneus subsp. pacificus DSM 12653]KUK09460.1 MAG: 30S ribosomal protein S20 [Caldanaerobacter subterraneus]MDI3519147.1 small subunit ribosomal protein [Caldanaerobacter sp.]AAM24199.1 Ribosomal protein S20 [Caldanaerobacter subterraneus subsp. tengcongensis MB4]TCO66812.1 SSU ribosoma